MPTRAPLTGRLGLLLKSKKERAPRRTVVQALFGGKTAFSGTKDTIVRGGEFEFEFGTAVHQSGPVRSAAESKFSHELFL